MNDSQRIAALCEEIRATTKTLNLLGAADAARRMKEQLSTMRVLDDDAPIVGSLKALRGKRMFHELRAIAEPALSRRPSPAILYNYAQALVDQGELSGGLAVVARLIRAASTPPEWKEEARGLRGRAYKQLFVRAAHEADERGTPLSFHGREVLQLALRAYEFAYQTATKDRWWPAVNIVALLVRAYEARVTLETKYRAEELAWTILEALQPLLTAPTCDEPWKLATGMEATLALQDDELTARWAEAYLRCPAADAFEFGSTHRQLSEIWRLQRNPGRRSAQLLAALEGQLLQKQGGQVLGAPGMRALADNLSDKELQSTWGYERFQSFRWMRNAVAVGACVGRVEKPDEAPVGSGFLVAGCELDPAWGNEPVFVTNRHVVSNEADRVKGVHWKTARVRFTGVHQERVYKVQEVLWQAPVRAQQDLDVSVLKLRDAPPLSYKLDVGEAAHLRAGRTPPHRLYVIGHPSGGPLSYSLYDNEFHSMEHPYLYYLSPTSEGSSGSALFDSDWLLLGVHHSASNVKKANCGSSFAALRKAIEDDRVT